MSQADVVLNGLAVSEHEHPVTDTDKAYTVDPFTRKIIAESGQKNILIQGDHNSERYTFTVPRFIEGHDMALCNVIQIPFINIEDAPRNPKFNTGVYTVTDLKVNKDTISFTWLISKNATMLVGTLSFMLLFSCIEGMVVTYRWGTDSYDDILVLTSKDGHLQFETEYIDIIEQWKQTVKNELYAYIDSELARIGSEVQTNIDANVDTRFSNFSEEINANLNTFDLILKTELMNVTRELNTQKSRMDVFTSLSEGSTTGDAELADIKVGYDGTVYGNAGTAVRKQAIGKVDKFGKQQVEGRNLAFAEVSSNILPPRDYDFTEIGMQINANTGETYTAASCSVTDYIPIEPDTTYYFYQPSIYGGCETSPFHRAVLFDINLAYIQSVTLGENREFITPSNARYIRFSENVGTGVSLFNKYLGTENVAPKLISSQWYRLPKSNEMDFNTINLWDTSRLIENVRTLNNIERGLVYTAEELLNPTNGYYRSADFIELDTSKDKLWVGFSSDTGVVYNNGDQKDISFFDDQHRYICCISHSADGVDIPVNARYFMFYTGNINAIISYEKQDTFVKYDPMYTVGGRDLVLADSVLPWRGKTWAVYGDSIGAISNGNGLGLGWADYVNRYHKFDGFYGRSIGGQCYAWRGHGGSVVFLNADGTFNSRNDSYNFDNYSGDIPEGCTAHRGCYSSWSRITGMFPESIKDSIDMIFIVGGTNDSVDLDLITFIEGDTTDPEWAASEYYDRFGGDYNIEYLRGAMASTVMKMQAWMPNALIVIGTNLSGRGDDGEGPTMDFVSDIPEYEKSIIEKEMAARMSCPCIDVFASGGITPWNRDEFISDAVHPYSDAGEMMLGRTVASGLIGILPKLAIVK